MRQTLRPLVLLFPVAFCVRDILDDRVQHSLVDASRRSLQHSEDLEELQLRALARHSTEDDDVDDQAEEDDKKPDKDGKEPDKDGKEPDKDGKESDKDGKEPDKDGKEPDKDGKEPHKDEKEPDKDEKEPDKDGKEPDKDGKAPDKDGKEPDKEGKEPDENGKEPDKDGKEPDKDGKEPDKDGKEPDKDGKEPDKDGKEPDEEKEEEHGKEHDTKESKEPEEETEEADGEEAGNIDRDQDVYAATAADQADISGAIDVFGSATKQAEQKAKRVDDKLAKYNGRIADLGERLDKLSRVARRYHMQTMRWFKDLEQAKYSPIANMPLDTFKISRNKDDFPLESAGS